MRPDLMMLNSAAGPESFKLRQFLHLHYFTGITLRSLCRDCNGCFLYTTMAGTASLQMKWAWERLCRSSWNPEPVKVLQIAKQAHAHISSSRLEQSQPDNLSMCTRLILT